MVGQFSTTISRKFKAKVDPLGTFCGLQINMFNFQKYPPLHVPSQVQTKTSERFIAQNVLSSIFCFFHPRFCIAFCYRLHPKVLTRKRHEETSEMTPTLVLLLVMHVLVLSSTSRSVVPTINSTIQLSVDQNVQNSLFYRHAGIFTMLYDKTMLVRND